MWNYEKRLQYPVKITQTNPKIAKIIIPTENWPHLCAISLKDILCRIRK